MSKTTEDQAIEKLQLAIVSVCMNMRACFWSVLIYRLKLVVDETLPTMGTNGVSILYNPTFVDSLTTPQLEGLLAHEASHCAMQHFWRGEGKEHDVWLQATDHVINLTLIEAGFSLPPDGLCDQRFSGMSEEQVYEILLKEPRQPQKGCCGGVHAPESSDHLPTLKANWEVATIQAAHYAKAQGQLPEFAKRLVEEIRKPKVDWKSVLRRWVQELAKADYSWKRPSTRYIPAGLYLPSLRSEQMPAIVIAVDTSGSIDQVTLDKFASEMQSIIDECKPERTVVMYCDAEVQRVDEFNLGETLEINPEGGGGTDFRPVLVRIEEDCVEPACLIYLTDMYGTFPKHAPDYPVLWASTTEDYDPPFGEMIYIGGE